MKVNEKCECVSCHTCNGFGSVWVSGDHMSAYRFDDMGDLETCPECDGDGLSSYCLKCSLEDEDDEWY
jgi:DnaJ-class molecular chaperone